MNADDILKNCIDGWGNEKDLYALGFEEMEVLLSDPRSSILEINRDNRDGTYYTKVRFANKIFATSTSQQFKNGP
ncbi:MAG: hypothetical protein PHO56_02975 [Patescibacteria group bacterium]|nr:hypothetical protein [Patescibacteria group bacterium]